MTRWRDLGLLVKFSTFSFAVLLALGVGLNFYISGYIEDRIFSNFAQVVVPSHNKMIARRLRSADFRRSRPITRRDLRDFVHEQILSQDLVAVKIWDRDGLVLWSNKQSLAGKHFKKSDKLRDALAGRSIAERTNLQGAEHVSERPQHAQLFEVYAPIRLDGETAGALEVYYSLDRVLVQTAQVKRTVIATITASISLLYLALFGMVRSASKTISRQNRSETELFVELTISLTELQANFVGTLASLSRAINARDSTTGEHSERINNITNKMVELLDLGEAFHERMAYAGLLHDIGKIGVREEVLQKPGALTDEEMDEIKRHPVVGAEIIGSVPFLRSTAEIIRHHHEHWNGGGYPDGLRAEEIPIGARVLAVADTFDAMTNERPYRAALSAQEALTELERVKGKQLDPGLVDLFLNVYHDGQDGRGS